MEVYRKYTYSLNKLTEEDWQYISDNRMKLLELPDDSTIDKCLKFPGFVINKGETDNKDIKAFIEFMHEKYSNTVCPRGNLSNFGLYKGKIFVIIVGIAPGYSNLSRNESKWLLGPSSKILHKMLYTLGIYPYFTNIYKQAFNGNNTNTANADLLESAIIDLAKELELVYNIQKDKKICLITLGKYKEYSVASKFWNANFKVINTYHPSYYLKNGALTIENSLIKNSITKIQDALEGELV